MYKVFLKKSKCTENKFVSREAKHHYQSYRSLYEHHHLLIHWTCAVSSVFKHLTVVNKGCREDKIAVKTIQRGKLELETEICLEERG